MDSTSEVHLTVTMGDIDNANQQALVTQRSIVSGIISMLVTMVPQSPPIASVARTMTNLKTNMAILVEMKSAFVNNVSLSMYNNMPAFVKKVDMALAEGATYIMTEMRNRIDCSFCGSMNVHTGNSCGARLVGSLHQVLASKQVRVNQHTMKTVYFYVQGGHAIHTDANMSGLYEGATRIDWGISQLNQDQLYMVLDHVVFGTAPKGYRLILSSSDRNFQTQLRDAAASL